MWVSYSGRPFLYPLCAHRDQLNERRLSARRSRRNGKYEGAKQPLRRRDTLALQSCFQRARLCLQQPSGFS